jgi:hypothetical protein
MDKPGNDIEIGDWYDEFVKNNPRITNPNQQCIAFAHHPQPDNVNRKRVWERVEIVDTYFYFACVCVCVCVWE